MTDQSGQAMWLERLTAIFQAGRTLTRLRPWLVALLTMIVGANCGSHDAGPLATTDAPASPAAPGQDPSSTPLPPGTPDSATTPDSSTSDSSGLPMPVSYTGLPFGPTGLWSASRLNWGPGPFTGSQNYISPDTVLLQISAARAAGQRLVLLYQYAHYVTLGNVVAWRDTVLQQASADGVTPMLSINVLNGGAQDRNGTWDCTGHGQAGTGTYAPNCRMTPDQVREFGTALAPYGCYMMLWRFDGDYMSDPANQEAFRDIAAVAASTPARSCKRP
jgi:hypothetical protein